jgi:low affinity Fe/Cu permease
MAQDVTRLAIQQAGLRQPPPSPGQPSTTAPISPERTLSRFANLVTRWTGGTWAFLVAVSVVLLWLISGPYFRYSDTWQLLINSGTSIVTFLMVFLIQRSQNKDSQAIHLKLNELIAAVNGASNRLIDIENGDDERLQDLQENFQKLLDRLREDTCATNSHSITEMDVNPVSQPQEVG